MAPGLLRLSPITETFFTQVVNMGIFPILTNHPTLHDCGINTALQSCYYSSYSCLNLLKTNEKLKIAVTYRIQLDNIFKLTFKNEGLHKSLALENWGGESFKIKHSYPKDWYMYMQNGILYKFSFNARAPFMCFLGRPITMWINLLVLRLKSWLAGPSSSAHLLFSSLALVLQHVVISWRHGSGYRELEKADVGGIADPWG